MNDTPTPKKFVDKVKSIPGGEHVELCYSCGTCVSKCMIQDKLEPEFNPRRLLRLVMMELEEEAFTSPTTWLCTECDLCYEACPQKIHISGVIKAVKNLAVQDGKTTPQNTAVVNQQTCVACGLCVETCPYQAIEIIQTKVPYRGMVRVAKVDPGKCMACGLCSAVCRSTSISVTEEYTDIALMDNLWTWLQRTGVEY